MGQGENVQMVFDEKRAPRGLSIVEMMRIYARATGVGVSTADEIKGLKILTTAGTYTILPDAESVIFEEG